MSSFFNRESKTLLGHLNADPEVRIKQSQSSEYSQAHSGFELDRLYHDLLIKMEKSTLLLGQQYQYRSETQTGKIAYIKMVLDYFTTNYLRYTSNQDTNEIQCQDCKNYQNSLQKLENDIRQHIRLEQQLKLYQESLEEKIEQQKKLQLETITKHEEEISEWRAKQKGQAHKIARLEEENERIRQQSTKNKSGLIGDHSHRAVRDNSQTKSFKALQEMKEMKENLVIQKNNMKKDEKKQEKKQQRKQPRKSADKRPQSTERWRYSNPNTNKHFTTGEKATLEKNKQQKRKAIQAKFDLRK